METIKQHQATQRIKALVGKDINKAINMLADMNKHPIIFNKYYSYEKKALQNIIRAWNEE